MATGNRTVLAQQAMDASDVIHMTFSKRLVGQSPPRRLVVQVPDGPSTDGGKRARQSITLAPAQGEGAALMCGWLDVGRKQAELRSYEVVAAQHESRFGQALQVTGEEYRDLMQDLARTLYNLSIDAHFATQAATPVRPSGSQSEASDGTGKAIVFALLGAAVGIGAAALYFLAR